MPKTNGIAERAVRTVLEGTRSLLFHSGFDKRWWSRAMRHFCLMYNATWDYRGRGTPWMLRHGCDFPTGLHPFGCKVFYTPGTTKANAGEEKFSPSSVPGILVGYHFNPGGQWSKDFLVINLEAALNNGLAKGTPFCALGRSSTKKGSQSSR